MSGKSSSLIDAFHINKEDIITIIGAGGKTSLMLSASSLLRKKYKVLVTTTTNIYLPDEKYYDEMIILSEYNNKVSKDAKYLDGILAKHKKGVYLIGSEVLSDFSKPKLKGLTFEMIERIRDLFDVILIEGDGSKEKPLKGWRDGEPVVYSKTTKTIGVVDISSLGLEIDEENIHRVQKFLEIAGVDWRNDKSPQQVSINHLKNIITNKEGLFRISRGEKILFINKCEDEERISNAENLINKLKNKDKIDKFIYGSILEGKFMDSY